MPSPPLSLDYDKKARTLRNTFIMNKKQYLDRLLFNDCVHR